MKNFYKITYTAVFLLQWNKMNTLVIRNMCSHTVADSVHNVVFVLFEFISFSVFI